MGVNFINFEKTHVLVVDFDDVLINNMAYSNFNEMGSMSIDCRTRMEIEATEEAVRFLTEQPLEGVVPEEEYAVQREGL